MSVLHVYIEVYTSTNDKIIIINNVVKMFYVQIEIEYNTT
jgi:hypothetical protein